MARGSTAGGSPIEACPYLRPTEAVAGSPGAPAASGATTPDAPACTAGPNPFWPGLRQRALVCATARFATCPRFPAADRRALDRAAAPARTPAPWAASGPAEAGPASRHRVAPSVPLPTAVAGVILVLALVAAFAFTAMRGGIDLAAAPGGTASPSPTAPAASMEPSPAVTPGSTTAVPSPRPSPTTTPGLASPVPSAIPSPAVSTAPAPTAAPADPRYAGLKPCPDRPDCYLYVVRRGDTLSSIAAFFGVSLRAVRDLNGDLQDPSIIRVGQKIRVPGPG